MLNRFCRLGFAMLLVAAGGGLMLSAAAQDVPDQLRPPANEQLLLQVHAKGDQVYICKSDAAQFNWTLKAPDAQLLDEKGKSFGRHFAGPSWEANDGSRVVGKAGPTLLRLMPIPFRGFLSRSSVTRVAGYSLV